LLSAAQLAAREQTPVPLVIVTVLPEIEHAPPARIDGVVLALVVEAAVKVEP
jgi:hypothetical protein